MTFRPHLASDEKVWQVFKALNDIKLQSLPVSPSLKDRVDYLTDLMLGIQVLEQNKEVIQSIQKKQESFWGWTQSWVTREQVLVNDFNSLETHLDRCLSEIEHSDNQEPFEHLFKDEFLKIERFSELSPKERLELYHFLDKMDILSKTSTVQKKCPSLKRIIQVKKEQIHVLLSINLQNWEAHFSRILENRQEDHEVICHLQSALNSFKKEFSDLKIGPLDKTTKDIIKNIEKIIEKFPKAKDLTSNKTIFSDPQKIHSEWLEFEHAMGLSEQGDPEQLTPHQQLIQYYYETGRLLLAKHHLKNTPHPTLATLIDEKLATINDWKKLPLDTFIYTDTYKPSPKSIPYPENIKHVVCLKTLDSSIFDTLKNVEEMILEIELDGRELQLFIINKLPVLKNLKSFTLKNQSLRCLSNHNELMEALKECPLLESLKLNTPLPLYPVGSSTIDLTSFPNLRTLQLKVVAETYFKISTAKILPKLEHLDLDLVNYSDASVDFSSFPNIKTLRLISSRPHRLHTKNFSVLDLENLYHLKTLELNNVDVVDSSGNKIPFDFSYHPKLTSLKIMNKNDTFKIKNSKRLSLLENLEWENVVFVDSSGDFLDSWGFSIPFDVSYHPKLTSLKITNNGSNCKIKGLKTLTHLQALSLKHVQLAHEQVSIINKTIIMPPSLKRLSLDSVGFPYHFDISHCRSLQKISLRYLSTSLYSENLLNTYQRFFVHGFGSCENLTDLDITGCILSPSEPALRNELRELPQKLIHLNLSRNNFDNISFIPFSRLPNLRTLDLRHNCINTLPDELAQLPSSCRVDLESNRLTNHILENFNSVLSRVQLENPQLGPHLYAPIRDNISQSNGFSLKDILLFWSQEIAKIIPVDFTKQSASKMKNDTDTHPSSQLSEDDQASLAKFLNRLTGIKDYLTPSTQNLVIKRVYDLLTLIDQKEDVRRDVLTIIKEGLASCDDRVTTAFDELEILVALHDDKKTLQEKAKLIIGLHRYKLLQEKINEASTKKLTGVKDEIELLLYAQLHLTKRLELPISTQNMLYPKMGETIVPYIHNIGKDILQQTSSLDDCCRILRNYISWDEYLKKQYSTQFQEIKALMDDKLEKLETDHLNSNEYNEQSQKVMRSYNEENDKLLDTLTTQILSQSIASSSS
ncbi:MAG: NEL-type E3 ubiquitin ligase domain-containing protein [Rhabdochlamydiaceae bacterium]